MTTFRARCGCGVTVTVDRKTLRTTSPCKCRPVTVMPATTKREGPLGTSWEPPPAPKRSPHNRAVRTPCDCGRTHPSKVEARVCARLRAEVSAANARRGGGWGLVLFQQARLPLWNLGPEDHGRPCYFHPDFVIADRGRIVRIVDAKSGKRRSPEWGRGKRAAEACYGMKVEETDR